MTKNNDFNPKTAIYTPPEVAKYGYDNIKWIDSQHSRGLDFFIPGPMSRYVAPILPGQLVSIIGQTSHFKSGLAHAWEYHAAKQLERQDRTNEIIIHVSVEESVEEQAMLLYGRELGQDAGEIARGKVQDWDRLEQATIKVGSIPIFRIGDSLARAEDFPKLYLSNMIRSIQFLQEDILKGEKKIAAIFFDYLQAFPIDPETRMTDKQAQRRLQIRSDVYRLRWASRLFMCPIVMLVQAKQILTSTGPLKIPTIYDGEESSSIAQRSDRILQLWLPKMSYPVDDWVEHGKTSFRVTEDLLLIKVGKQRGRLPSGKTFLNHINYTQNIISPIETNISILSQEPSPVWQNEY